MRPVPTALFILLACLLTPASLRSAPPVPAEAPRGDDLSGYVWNLTDPGFSPDRLLPLFSSMPIPDKVFERMRGRSYPAGCTVDRSDLRYLILPHYDGHGHVRIGEMVANRAIAADLIDIFRQLYLARYPIERMELIDRYDGDDQRSMAANNTSCFNYRRVAGSKKLSRHAFGMAVDLNPLYNPFVRTCGGKQTVEPANGRPYADRSRSDNPYRITTSDLAYRLFRAHGFKWGGSWRTSKDYQHFQK